MQRVVHLEPLLRQLRPGRDLDGRANDANIFIGSSNIGDGAGRQLWDNKLGTLRGDRPNVFKVYGSYSLPWNATAGFFAIAQSGQPWETHGASCRIRALTTSTSDTDRYAEPAGIAPRAVALRSWI